MRALTCLRGNIRRSAPSPVIDRLAVGIIATMIVRSRMMWPWRRPDIHHIGRKDRAVYLHCQMNHTKKIGIVHLVGAGPGDPGLLTVRGKQLLEQADVVVYDALSDPRLLSHARNAQHIFVGKRAAAHSFTQEQINQLLIDAGREGKRVVRLKGGDPFVFGRGGEECEALHDAGIAFEVVPGITAAIAAPCYAGIPVTHRDFNSSFTLVTGHEKEEECRDPRAEARGLASGSSDLDWSA